MSAIVTNCPVCYESMTYGGRCPRCVLTGGGVAYSRPVRIPTYQDQLATAGRINRDPPQTEIHRATLSHCPLCQGSYDPAVYMECPDDTCRRRSAALREYRPKAHDKRCQYCYMDFNPEDRQMCPVVGDYGGHQESAKGQKPGAQTEAVRSADDTIAELTQAIQAIGRKIQALQGEIGTMRLEIRRRPRSRKPRKSNASKPSRRPGPWR